ncbi:hypothetical protein [Polynucleobacter sp. 15G-AUS-farblos]|uniref:hypothetical protein n=1 Tax=Polynucleobacter sp. 15G-AUS-farblos TaxID=2689094 RepID=UPI001C0D6AD7|nr:hypothetical protein [Polynucleobacter sp. 15G-AUS-farblos]
MAAKQIQYEKTQALIADGDRALELIGRAIRMAGYRNINTSTVSSKKVDTKQFILVEKKSGYRGSDFLKTHHGLSGQADLDCIGNTMTSDRTKHQMAYQGFLVERQAGIPKGAKVNGGSLICQSLDRQGRIQNTTLMNGVNTLNIEEMDSSHAARSGEQKLYRIRLQMTDGRSLNVDLERTFATRNLL